MVYFRMFDGADADKYRNLNGVVVADGGKIFVPTKELGEYPSVIVNEDDFVANGFDLTDVPKNHIEHAARKMGDAMVSYMYWELIEQYGERLTE